jgi:TRAP-type uncharacterized transport system fused permease subunit
VPFAFVLSPNGEALLLQGSVGQVAIAFAVSALAVAALAAATGHWMIGPARIPERVLAALAALALLYLEPITIAIGLAALVLALVVHLIGRRAQSRTRVATP